MSLLSTQKVTSIHELEELANSLAQECRSGKPHKYAYVSPVLFRGQSRASWKLETTLERFGKCDLSVEDYVGYLCRVQPAIEAYTDRNFAFKDNQINDSSRTFPLSNVRFLPGQYEFMVYLRHHGFPSPLLDWTRSLYVALYFACSGIKHEDDSALYMYVESLGYVKTIMVGAPEIATMGQYVSAHKRHFIQQSEYTACIAKIHEEWCYYSHEAAFGISNDRHDKLVKVLIPAQLRSYILQKLDAMNINDFSLFGTEEALMQTLAFRELNASEI